MFESGKLFVGCNYWASHAGTEMWADWQPEIIENDFKKLKSIGMELIRVFPNWRDFQPMTAMYEYSNHFFEYRMNEKPLPDTAAGRAGVSEIMLSRFKFVADTALKYNLKLSVGLITGWMSGRQFRPSAFQDVNVLTDGDCIRWQVKFIRLFVKTFKDHPAIAMWGPGNECNCLGEFNRGQFWVWCNTIAGAIRAEDSSHPIAAGMHALFPSHYASKDAAKGVSLQDMGEIWDLLTVHPYPLFTAHASREPLHYYRNVFHAVAEGCMYRDIGGKPTFSEELGTFSEMWCSEETKSSYLRNILFNIWAHDGGGLLWWCAFDQNHLTHAPYDWLAIERELGIMTPDYQVKPFAAEFTNVKNAISSLPFDVLPPMKIDACCILTKAHDQWGAAWGSFVLAKQANFNLKFAYGEDVWPDSPLYLVPSMDSIFAMSNHKFIQLIEKVTAGATLYISLGKIASINNFNKLFGVEVQYRHEIKTPLDVVYQNQHLPVESEFQCIINPVDAELLATANGSGIFFKHRFGKGTVYLFDAPLEISLINSAMRIPDSTQYPYYKIYEEIGHTAIAARLIQRDDPMISTSEHYFSDNEAVVILVNNQPKAASSKFTMNAAWTLDACLYGVMPQAVLTIPANDAIILRLRKNDRQRTSKAGTAI